MPSPKPGVWPKFLFVGRDGCRVFAALPVAMAVALTLLGSLLVCDSLKAVLGLRLDQEEEYQGADLSIHRITSTPEREPNW